MNYLSFSSVADSTSLSSTATLTVVITDINDEAPEFNPTSYAQSVKENLIGMLIR